MTYPVTPNPAIHERKQVKPDTQVADRLAQLAAHLPELIVGMVAQALGGINIFGLEPLGFLKQWGQDRIDDALGALSTANTAQTNAQSALTNIGQVSDSIVNNMSGQGGAGATATDVARVIQSQSHTILNHSAQINKLLTQQGAPSGGTAVGITDDFNSLSAWNTTSGISISNGNAVFSASSTTEFVARNNTASNTDTQSVSCVLGSAAGAQPWWPSPTNFGYNDVWARMSTSAPVSPGMAGICFRVGANGAWSVIANGSTLASGTASAPNAGSIMEIDVNAHLVSCYLDNQLLANVSDGGASLGSGFRGWGFGGRAESNAFGMALPGSVNQWAAYG